MENEVKYRGNSLPKGIQITPGRFLVLNKSYPNSLITIDNLTWTTYAVYVKTPKWINCQKKFMLEAKSNAEFEVSSNVDKKLNQTSLNDKIKITFIDMSNKEIVYSSKLLVEYTNYNGKSSKQHDIEAAKSLFLLQFSLIFLICSIGLLIYHYKFQEKYYLCLFQSTLCELNKVEDVPWLKKIFRC